MNGIERRDGPRPLDASRVQTEFGRELEHYIREIYVIILGLGFGFFVQSFVNNLFNNGTFKITGLVFFLSLYYFFSYDWVAYTSLTRRFPYRVTRNLRSMGRFYSDLFALLVKACLIFIATQRVDFYHLLSAAILFSLWHASILVWYYFGTREQREVGGDDMPEIWRSHLFMVAIYLAFSLGLLYSGISWPQTWTGTGVRLSLLLLCTIIVLHAALRKRYLLEQLEAV